MLTHSQSDEAVADMADLSISKEKRVIRILHVDDDLSVLEISKLMLIDIDGNFEIDQACCVDEAFKKLASSNYDVVISDYEMPQKDGLQFLRELREGKNAIPFILFTGKGREEVAIKALNLGADGYINKQSDPETTYGELSHNIKLVVEHYKAKKELQERDIRFAKIASQTPGMLYQFMRRPNGTYNVPFSSESIREIFGCSPLEVLEDFSPIAKVIVPEDLNKVFHSIEYSATHLTPWQCEYRVQLPGKQIRWLWGKSVPERLDDGSILWNGFNADITERKNFEEKLEKNQEQMKAIILNAPIGIATSDSNHFFLTANAVFCRILGFSEDELKKLTFKDITHPDKINESVTFMEKLISGEIPFFSLEKRYIRKDGQAIDGKVTVSAIRNKDGKPTLFIAELEDITERKKAGNELKQKYDVLERVGESVGAGLAIIGKDYNIFWANELLRNIINGANKKCYQTFNKLDSICPDCGVKKIFEQNVTFDAHEYETVNSKGEKTWIELRVTPLKDKNGETIAALELAVPITERKQAETALRRSEARYRDLANSLPEIVFEAQATGMLTFVNQKALEIMGYSSDDVKHLNIFQCVAPQDQQRAKENIQKRMQGEKPAGNEYLIQRKDGTTFPGMVFTEKIISEDGTPGLRGVIVNISQTQKIKEELTKGKRRFESLFMNNLDGVIVAKRDGRIVAANPAICRMLGMTEQEVLTAGRKGIIVDEPRNDVALKEQDAVGEVVARIAFRRKDSSTFEAEISSKEFVDVDGSTSLLVTVRDIGNRLMLEDKLRTVGSFSRHDIRNKLLSAGAQLFLTKKLAKDQLQIRERLDQIEVSLHSIGTILNSSEDYEAIGSQKLSLKNVGKAVDDALTLLGDLKGIKVTNKVGLCEVLADQMLTTLFYNLIENTIKHGQKATCIDVYFQKNNDGSKNIIYQDDGAGISDEDKMRLFEKGFGKGSGYGLFLVKETCKIYGWTIIEKGKPGKGAKFEITIPTLCLNHKKTD